MWKTLKQVAISWNPLGEIVIVVLIIKACIVEHYENMQIVIVNMRTVQLFAFVILEERTMFWIENACYLTYI